MKKDTSVMPRGSFGRSDGECGRALVAVVMLASLGMGMEAHAQIPPPDTFNPVDANGVSLTTGTYRGPDHALVIGSPGGGGLSVTVNYDTSAGGWRHSLAGGIATEPLVGQGAAHPWYMLTIPNGGSMAFWADVEGNYIPIDAVGTLSPSNVYTAPDGTVVTVGASGTHVPYRANRGQVSSVVRPNGERQAFTYTTVTMDNGFPARRLQSVTNNYGYQIHFQYASDVWDQNWTRIVKITALNNAVDACAPTANTCSFSQTWPSLTFAEITGQERSVTDSLGRKTRYLLSGNQLMGYASPTRVSGADISFTYATYNETSVRIATATTASGTWSYTYALPLPAPYEPMYYELASSVQDPLGNVTLIRNGSWNEDPFIGRRIWRLASVRNPLLQTTTYGYDEFFRLSTVTHPEGNKETYGYTDLGSLAGLYQTAKPGSSELPISIGAGFTNACGTLICERIETFTDARGGVTDYTYDAAGNLLTTTGPAPTPGAARPQTRYQWEQRYAWYKQNGSSAITQAASPVWVQVGSSQCMTGATC